MSVSECVLLNIVYALGQVYGKFEKDTSHISSLTIDKKPAKCESDLALRIPQLIL